MMSNLMVKSRHDKAFCRNLRHTVPLLKFRFEFVLPKLRKARNIVLRDELGRIVRSEVPGLALAKGAVA